jgi:hypothetical protein
MGEEEKRDPPLHEATADNGAAQSGPDLAGARIIPNKNRALQVAPAPGRKLFDEARKRAFLEWFAGTGNVSLSAREAGVNYRTVLRHRAEDAGFRADFDQALEQSRVRLRAWAMEARDDGRTDYDPDAHAPAHLDAGQVLQLLRDDAQREAALARAGSSGGGFAGRRPTVASNAEVREALVKALVAHGLRVRARDEAGEGEAAAAEEAPPPGSAWSPSPANAGEE